ncbi:MAG TPA: reverse transcriptase-like protein [Patescibacteria group bacterium]|nr:reverse transcriptase-like protein [Patescibacteria group bacterium]
MKTLKFEHHLAELIREGKKTSTWRLYDDKDLSVNDEVELLDKVDPAKPETWQRIGVARIDSVIQKRLGDIEPDEFDRQEQFSSQKQMLETYQHYYGPQVNAGAAVKIIHFTLESEVGRSSDTVDDKSTYITELKLYADGGSRGNPGPSASGYVLMQNDGTVLVKKSLYLGVTTNNQAEYQALKLGLEEAARMHVRRVQVFMDSLLVVNQMRGTFKIKNRDLWPIHTAITELLPQFEQVTFTHVPRELNKLADDAVNEALDNALKH